MSKKIPKLLLEESEAVGRAVKSLQKLSDEEMKDSYFLRDLVIACTEKIVVTKNELLERLEKLGISISKKTLNEAIDLWRGDNSVQAYRTPKLLLYTLRGDYEINDLKVAIDEDVSDRMNSELVEELRGNVRELVRDKKFIEKIVAKAISRTGIEPDTVLRRDYDGNSEVSLLVEKMIGEFLIEGTIKR